MNSLKRRIGINYVKSIIIILLLLNTCITVVLEAGNNTKDLEQKLTVLPDDTAKVNVLLKLGKDYCGKQNDKALMFLQEAFTISTALDYKEGIGKSLLWQGRVYYYKDDYALSDKYLDKAKILLEKIDDSDDLIFYYFAKGVNYNIRGDYIHAMEMFKNAIALSEKTGNEKWTSTSYMSLGTVLLNRNEPEKALKYFNEAEKRKKKVDDQYGLASVYTSIGLAYQRMGITDTALYYLNKGLSIRKALQSDRLIASSNYHIGGIFLETGEYLKAEKSLQTALDIFEQLKDNTGIIISALRLADAENHLGKSKAIVRADDALNLAKEIKNPNLTSFAYKKLSQIYAFNKDYKKSYNYLLNHINLQDSLFTAEKERVLTEMEAKFQSERKDRDIALLKEKTIIEQNRNIMLIILLVVFLIVIFLLIVMFKYKSTAFKRQQKLLEQDKIIYTQEKEINKKEKQLLQEQLESKNRELASKALEMIRLNETITEIIEKLEDLKSSDNTNPELFKSIRDIIHDLETHTKQNIWNEFDKIFKNIHTGFYARLLETCPGLTSTEIKIAALLKLNLTTKEIAAITFKSEGGIKTTRYRLRKKLGLSGDDKLVPFLMQI